MSKDGPKETLEYSTVNIKNEKDDIGSTGRVDVRKRVCTTWETNLTR